MPPGHYPVYCNRNSLGAKEEEGDTASRPLVTPLSERKAFERRVRSPPLSLIPQRHTGVKMTPFWYLLSVFYA